MREVDKESHGSDVSAVVPSLFFSHISGRKDR